MENKYLTLARQARADGNTEDAKLYYGKLREEMPEDAEAKFFYAYFAMYEGKNGEIPKRFETVCKALFSSISLVKASEQSAEDKLSVINEIVSAFVPETWALNRYMNKKNHETKVGNSYVTVFEMTTVINVSKMGMKSLCKLGDEIINAFGSGKEVGDIAVIAWKEYVSLCQKWYAWAPKGDADAYAEKIKKFCPG